MAMTDVAKLDAPAGGDEARVRAIMLVAVALLGAVVLAGLVLTLGEANKQRDRALRLQTHSSQVTFLARTLSATIARAEATLGRYVISADRQLGVSFGESWRRAGDQIDQLDRLTAGSTDRQRSRIDTLRTAYQKRGDELSLIALSTRYKKNPQALARYYQARNSPSLTEINGQLDAIIDTERDLLTERTSQALQSVRRSTDAARVLAAFGALLVLGAVALGWMTVTALAQRSIARAEADAERERGYELERAIAEATAELKQQAIERAATEEKLRQAQKMDAVGQLTGGIAHDFNNMLAVVLGGLELARRNREDPHAILRHLDNATEGANRAVALTRRLLAFSREEALLPTAIDAADVIGGMSDLLDRTLGDAITVIVTGGTGGWTTWVDRHQLENALLNLAVNARDAMEGRGTLTFATGTTTLVAGQIGNCAGGDHVTIAVTDTGSGMTPDVLERVFEPFFTTKPVGKGTGLGLSQIFAFVRQSGGEVAIASAPGEGTTATLYLPRHIGDRNQADAPVPSPSAASPKVLPVTRPLRILVVEDDPRVLASTTAALAELGHRPIDCGDPLRALGLIEADGDIDLIVTDVLMPRLTGPELVAQITARHPAMSVLFVTGYAGDAGGAEEFGGHNVLRKPFTIAALERAISVAVQPTPTNRPDDMTPSPGPGTARLPGHSVAAQPAAARSAA